MKGFFGFDRLLKVLFAALFVLSLFFVSVGIVYAGENVQALEQKGITVTAQEKPAEPAGAEKTGQPEAKDGKDEKGEKPGDKDGKKDENKDKKKEPYNPLKNLETWQAVLLASTPVIIVGIFFLASFIRSKMGGEDEGVAADAKSKKSGKAQKPKSKHDRRLQLALDLLNHRQIGREGALETDFYLRSVVGSNKGEMFKITKYVCKIGRRSTDGRINDIQFSSLEKKVSRSQGLLVYKVDEDTFYYVNESDVPVFVNGDRVKEAYPLREGDRIKFSKKDGPELAFAREVVEVE